MSASRETTKTDIVIIGAGPAGSAAANVLAAHGKRVLVLEKETFPRYVVGESLIPYCYFPLKRLGLIDALNQGHYQKKQSVQFVRKDGRVSQPFYFPEHLDHPAAHTWQVERATFDTLLANKAREAGAEVREGVKVTQPLMAGNTVVGVRATGTDGRSFDVNAPMTIDASGRSIFSISRNDWRVAEQGLQKLAIWTYYEGATRDTGIDEGATTVAYVNDKNWFWFIPMANNLVSVGIVGAPDYLYRPGKNSPLDIFEREIQNNEWIRAHLESGKRVSDVKVTSDFSYRSRYVASDGLVLAGDAMGFLDPVFSSGVMLALRSGVLVGDAVNDALNENDLRAERFSEYGTTMRNGYEAMRMLVYAFYDPDFSFKTLFEKHPDLRNDLTDCLIGHVERDYTKLRGALSKLVAFPDRDTGQTLGVPDRAHSADHTGNR